MKLDQYWKSKITNYANTFSFFAKNLKEKTDIVDHEMVMQHWCFFVESICDCEDCREDEDCTIHINIGNFTEETEQ